MARFKVSAIIETPERDCEDSEITATVVSRWITGEHPEDHGPCITWKGSDVAVDLLAPPAPARKRELHYSLVAEQQSLSDEALFVAVHGDSSRGHYVSRKALQQMLTMMDELGMQ